MHKITPEKVKRNNSDLFKYSKELCKALRKERFHKPLHEKYLNYCIAADKLSVNPYEDANFAMDLEKFSNTLKGLELICFQYFLEGLIQEEIACIVGKTQGRVSQILAEVIRKFEIFYKDAEND